MNSQLLQLLFGMFEAFSGALLLMYVEQLGKRNYLGVPLGAVLFIISGVILMLTTDHPYIGGPVAGAISALGGWCVATRINKKPR